MRLKLNLIMDSDAITKLSCQFSAEPNVNRSEMPEALWSEAFMPLLECFRGHRALLKLDHLKLETDMESS